MKNIYRRMMNYKLHTRLMLCFSTMVIVSIVLVGAVAYAGSYQIVENLAYSFSKQSADVYKRQSHDKGKDVKAKCDNGCIACTLCTKQCEFDAIHMDNNVAVIDYEKCTNCGKCAAKCPAKVIL